MASKPTATPTKAASAASTTSASKTNAAATPDPAEALKKLETKVKAV